MRQVNETEETEVKECLYKAYRKASTSIAGLEDCMSVAYPAYETDSIRIEVRIKRKEQ